MEETIMIGDKPLRLKSTAAFLLKYKAQFRSDPIKDLMQMSDWEDIELETLYNVVWSLAKNADDTIEEPMAFFDSFESLPILDKDFINTVIDLALGSMGATVKPKKLSSPQKN